MIGSFFQKRQRWYWRVRLPGDEKIRSYAMIPRGRTVATKDRQVAVECAKRMLEQPSQRPIKTIRTVNDLCTAYLDHAADYYGDSQEPTTIEIALRPLRAQYGALLIEELSPLKLKNVRQTMIDGKTLCRNEINRRIGIVKRMYRWAVEDERVSPTVYEGLRAVSGLKAGRTDAIDHPDRKPAQIESVEAVLPFTTPVVQDMVRLHVLTGMRPEELCRIRPDLIDRSTDPWVYTPCKHKMSYRGQRRKIFLGPKAQAILAKSLFRDDYCFTPADSERWRMQQRRQERQTPLYGKAKGRPVSPRKTNDYYTPSSYRHAVKYAQDAAREAGVEFVAWTPYQIRHTHADMIRQKAGLDAAAAVLGHKDVETTKIYAKLRDDKAIDAATRYG